MSNQPTRTVPGYIKLRHNSNSSLTSILNNLFGLFLRIEKTIRTHLMKLCKLLTFDPKSLILSQVPVKHVEFHGCHCIEISFQDFGWFVMPANIDQQSPPTESWLVVYFRSGEKVTIPISVH